MSHRVLMSTLLVIFMAASVRAVPSQITVQGRLTDAVGAPLPVGAKTFTFRIFSADVGGTQVWPTVGSEVQSISSGVDGLWIGLLGAINPLSDAVFADSVRWLETNVDGTILPRIRLVTGPYAFRVGTVDGASGGTITSKVSIGPGHTNTGASAFVAGESNQVSGNNSTITGGIGNTASAGYATIDGGQSNTASALMATIGGGDHNTASGMFATVGGGDHSVASNSYATVGGGRNDTASGWAATVGGGYRNVAGGDYACVGGGSNNRARGRYSFVGGGGGLISDSNAAIGDFSVVPGGLRNAAAGTGSLAAGTNSKALHTGAFVWSESQNTDFASTDVGQFLIRASGGVGVGTNAPEGPMHVFEASAGAMIANSASTAVFENDATNYISVLSPDNTDRGILFGSPLNSACGAILFDTPAFDNGFEFRANTNDTRMTLDAAGNLTVVGCVDGNNTACASDARFKKNISTVEDAVNLVKLLRGVHYEWRRDEFPERSFESGKQYGVIAQEVREVLPELVREREDGYFSVEYTSLIPILLEAIKAQQKRIEALEKKLEQQTP